MYFHFLPHLVAQEEGGDNGGQGVAEVTRARTVRGGDNAEQGVAEVTRDRL